MQPLAVFLALLTTPSAFASPANTDRDAPESGPYAFGLRVGGYGFRRGENDKRNAWDDCRMNGIGIFGQRTLGRHFFLEAGADVYFAESWPFPLAEGESDMSRISGLGTFAAGARLFPEARVSPYGQVGIGIEVTRFSMHEQEANRVFPVAFVGVGADIRIGDRVRIGANLRANAMGHFEHSHATHKHAHPLAPTQKTPLNAEPEIAAQMQFYLSYSM